MKTENVEQSNKRKTYILTGIIGVMAIAVFSYWVFYRRFEAITQDTYVHGNMININPKVTGFVDNILTEETRLVEEGQVIVKLNTIDAEISYREAKAHFANTIRKVAQKYDHFFKIKAELDKAKAEIIKTKVDYIDRKNIVDSGAVSREDYIASESNYLQSKAVLHSLSYELKTIHADIHGTTVYDHPEVLIAKQNFIDQYVHLERFTIYAPATGIVANRTIMVGECVTPETTMMVIVPLDQMWANANFRETDLKHIRVGQSVEITSLIYGEEQKYHGYVEGIGGGSGAVFSVLPPQNATGNWVKIVQRVPVRIHLSKEEIRKHPLRLGLTLTARVDISDQEGKMNPSYKPTETLWKTKVYDEEEKGVGVIIEEVYKKNVPSHQPTKESIEKAFEEVLSSLN